MTLCVAIPRTHAVCCLDCDMVTRPTEHGRCGFCNSEAVYWLVRIVERKPAEREQVHN